MKKSKIIILAVGVVVFGVFLIGGIKLMSHNSTKEEKYICTLEGVHRTDEFEIAYKKDLPSVVSLRTVIEGPARVLEDGTVNESADRIAYESAANALKLGYEAFNQIEGFEATVTEDNGLATGIVKATYDKLEEESVSTGLFPSKQEKINDYIKRLEEATYKCETLSK